MPGENNVDQPVCGFKRKRDDIADIPRELSEPEGGWVCDAGRCPMPPAFACTRHSYAGHAWIWGIADALTSGPINSALD